MKKTGSKCLFIYLEQCLSDEIAHTTWPSGTIVELQYDQIKSWYFELLKISALIKAF